MPGNVLMKKTKSTTTSSTATTLKGKKTNMGVIEKKKGMKLQGISKLGSAKAVTAKKAKVEKKTTNIIPKKIMKQISPTSSDKEEHGEDEEDMEREEQGEEEQEEKDLAFEAMNSSSEEDNSVDSDNEEEENEEDQEKEGTVKDTDMDVFAKNNNTIALRAKDEAVLREKIKNQSKISIKGETTPGVIYLGRIPHGFYEDQMKAYFSQFGEISKIRLSRNKKVRKMDLK